MHLHLAEAKQFSCGNLPFAVETLFNTVIPLKMETFAGGSTPTEWD